MYGLWGYLLKAKALAPISARRVVEGGWYLNICLAFFRSRFTFCFTFDCFRLLFSYCSVFFCYLRDTRLRLLIACCSKEPLALASLIWSLQIISSDMGRQNINFKLLSLNARGIRSFDRRKYTLIGCFCRYTAIPGKVVGKKCARDNPER